MATLEIAHQPPFRRQQHHGAAALEHASELAEPLGIEFSILAMRPVPDPPRQVGDDFADARVAQRDRTRVPILQPYRLVARAHVDSRGRERALIAITPE